MPAAPNPALEILAFAGSSTTRHPLPASGSLTIGRDEDNDLPLDDPAVSRRHAVLHLGPPLRVEDVGSANGTRVIVQRRASAGTAQLQETRLAPGESLVIELGAGIAIGGTIIVVQPKDEQAPLSSRMPRSAVAPIVRDPVMKQVYERVGRVAQGNISVLLLGETGVGKEVMADAIHRRSLRAAKPFLCLNCAAFTESLLENELFGHEPGAFTGAVKVKPGLLEMADRGTVFLDEVGEIPMSLQVKLLRVLEERKVLRVGGLKPRSIDVRFISATNRDLQAEVERGAFRQDLFFRLNGICLTIPPLRERSSEIVPLAQSFLRSVCEQLGRRAVPELTPEAIEALERHDWPGNIRELRNVMERAVMLSSGNRIVPEHLELQRSSRVSVVSQKRIATLRMQKGSPEQERARILDALEQCAGNQTRAAELLGVSRRTLVNRLEEYGITRPRKRP